MPPPTRSPHAAERLRLVVADDDALVRSAVVDVLEADDRCRVLAAVASADAAVDATRRLRPDAVVLDLRMPGGGLEAARRIQALRFSTTVTVMSASWLDSPTLVSLLRAGVTGVVVKGASNGWLPDMVARCCRGEVLVMMPSARGAVGALAQPDLG